MSAWNKAMIVLIIVGGINWGLVGLFSFNLVGWLLGGSASLWSRIIYVVVGLAALCAIPTLFLPAGETTGEG